MRTDKSTRVAVAIAGLAALLAGCATSANYAENVNGYIGQPIDAVVLDMGPPDSSFQLAEGNWVFEWEEISIERRLDRNWGHVDYIETNDGRIVPIHRPSLFGSDVDEITRICTTRFTTSSERVVQGVTFEGNGCRA